MSTILSFSEMVICIVKQWKKSIGYTYCFGPECNHAQEMQLCTGKSDISIFISTSHAWLIFCYGQVLLVRKGNKQTNIISKHIVVCKIVPVMH